MLCCLLFSLLLAQAGAAARRVRVRIGGLLARTGPRLALIGVNAVAAGFVVLHWDHLTHEARAMLSPAPPPSQQICTGDGLRTAPPT